MESNQYPTTVATLDRAKQGEERKAAAVAAAPGPLALAPLDEARAFAYATGIKQLEGLVRRIIALEGKEKDLQAQCNSLTQRLAALETAARNSGSPHLANVERR